MNSLDIDELGIAVLGRGEAEGSQRSSYADSVKSKVRYADPAAWAVLGAVGQALAYIKDERSAFAERTGVLLVSEHGPVETMEIIAASAQSGYLSPLRFPAATPGSLVGLTCIAFGLRGPTLNLTMPTPEGVPIAAVVAGNWLKRNVVNFMCIATCQSGPIARCLLLARKETGLRDYNDSSLLSQSRDLAWLLIRDHDMRVSQEEV